MKNKKRFKHPSTSSANPNERDLARWMEVQKMAYKKGRLTKYQIERLEIIPMWSWENPISPEDHEAPENLPKPSALDKVSLEELVKYTAMGFELEDVDGGLFVWFPFARELLFDKHYKIAEWLRDTWCRNSNLGIGYDCTLVPSDGVLNLSYKDEQHTAASYSMSEDEARDFKNVPYVYIRSFNRSKVHICLPKER